jgi:crotonobetainyl-CoA:carnitine CoA-transferase CaiB-like acyl-CoA transferase
VHDFDSLLEDAHLKEIGFFRRVDHPLEGRMIELANPNKFSAGLRAEHRPAPAGRRQRSCLSWATAKLKSMRLLRLR